MTILHLVRPKEPKQILKNGFDWGIFKKHKH